MNNMRKLKLNRKEVLILFELLNSSRSFNDKQSNLYIKVNKFLIKSKFKVIMKKIIDLFIKCVNSE